MEELNLHEPGINVAEWHTNYELRCFTDIFRVIYEFFWKDHRMWCITRRLLTNRHENRMHVSTRRVLDCNLGILGRVAFKSLSTSMYLTKGRIRIMLL
ncbi:uncharacterized protein VTP21DRAFT_7941 [Calcarisporiella thermophila]|uniref:uncharacterized protein n=1 Tax=Calcarisporiella thermophila TaxID=911321 RepID=UPI0037448E30